MSYPEASVRCSYMPLLLPREHLFSALKRALRRGSVADWRDLVPESKLERGDFCPGHVLRPVYAATACQYGGLSIPAILEDHTLWKYFRSFIPGQPKDVPNYSEWESLYNHSRVLYPLRQVRYRQAKQWRWCLACNQEDYRQYGTCIWHVEHQLPGVAHCLKHPSVLLLGACSSCQYQVNDISSKSVNLRPEHRCPKCGNTIGVVDSPPDHPLIDWVLHVSNELFLNNARFNTQMVYSDIFNTLGYDPSTKPTLSQNKKVSAIRKEIEAALPMSVINWFFQTKSRGHYSQTEVVSPLDLRQLYKHNDFIHPLSWLCLCWIVLAKTQDMDRYITSWKDG